MTKEEKQLLLKDLCARLPYGVMCDRLGHPLKLVGVHPNKEFALEFNRGEYMPTEYTVDDVKPYLRSMSSITVEERAEVKNYMKREQIVNVVFYHATEKTYDWYNAHHFDYRGLIEKGLALEAPADMYKTE